MERPTVWLARHGETEWSRAGKHTGRTDIPLTENGVRQAAALGPALAAVHFERVICSPLLRARQTCEGAGLLAGAEIRDEIAEWDYGSYEGITTAEIHQSRPDWLLWADGAPGGESPEQVGARLDPLIAELRAGRGDSIVFAHGHILRVFAARWIEQPTIAGQRLALGTGTLSRLGFEHDYPVIRAWNSPVG